MPDAGCPNPILLERLMLGQLHGAEADAVEAHVAGCQKCGEAMAALPVNDPLVDAVKAARGEPETCTDLVLVLIRQLKKLGLHETITHVGRTAYHETGSFDFLDPPRDGDEMGWLGPYRVLKLIGSGGMGVVFLADDPRLKRQVALKVIKPELLPRVDLRERFLKEAQTIARVEHENIVAIHDIGEQRGVPYLVMPLLRGESFEARLRRVKGPLPLDESLRIAREIASGLAAAHAQGLIHRDIKPGNIFLSQQKGAADRVKVLDFGLARVLSDEDPAQPQVGVLVGTPAFMAPEQAAGHPADHRADLFSLGSVLYRMAAGRQVFPTTDLFALLMQIAADAPTPPAQVNPAVPAELSRLILRLLAKKPDERPARAEDVAAALKKIEDDRQSRISRRRWLIAAGGLTAAAAGALLWSRRQVPVAALPPEPESGEVTLELDGPPSKLLLTYRGEPRAIEVNGQLTESLEPGKYQLSKADAKAKRRPWPEKFDVEAGEVKTVGLRLIGELVHNDFPGSCSVVACSPVKDEFRVLASDGSDGGRGKGVWVWDGKTAEKPEAFHGHGAIVVKAVAIARDGRRAASGGGYKRQVEDPPILLWDVRTLEVITRLPAMHDTWIHALAFSPDGERLASGANDGKCYIWDLNKNRALFPLGEGHEGQVVHGITFTPNGRQVLTAGGDGRVLHWDAATGKKRGEFTGHKGKVRSVAATDDVAVSAGNDGTVRLWDLKSGLERWSRKPGGHVDHAVFTLDGGHVLWSGVDGSLHLYDVGTGTEKCRLDGPEGCCRGVACAADGRRAATCGQDGLRMWELPQ